MPKYYLPPTVEDETSENSSESFTSPSESDSGCITPRDQSRRASSSTNSSNTLSSDFADSGSRAGSLQNNPNSIDVDSWERVLKLHEENKDGQPPQYHLSSMNPTTLPRRSSQASSNHRIKTPANPPPHRTRTANLTAFPARRTHLHKRAGAERDLGDEDSAELARVKRALLEDPVGLALGCRR